MRHAAIDVTGEMLPLVARTLADYGLKFVGSFNLNVGFGYPSDTVRLIVADETDNLLPAECNNGWWLVRATFSQHAYGEQRLTKVDEITLDGELCFGANGEMKVVARQAA